jgi:hypothetical protein
MVTLLIGKPMICNQVSMSEAGHNDGAENWAILRQPLPNNRLDARLPGTWVAARPQQQRAA